MDHRIGGLEMNMVAYLSPEDEKKEPSEGTVALV